MTRVNDTMVDSLATALAKRLMGRSRAPAVETERTIASGVWGPRASLSYSSGSQIEHLGAGTFRVRFSVPEPTSDYEVRLQPTACACIKPQASAGILRPDGFDVLVSQMADGHRTPSDITWSFVASAAITSNESS